MTLEQELQSSFNANPVNTFNQIEALGEFLPYDSQLPIKEVKDTRIVKCLYQVITSGINKGKKKGINSYTRIPSNHLTEEVIISRVAELSPFILEWLQSVESEGIKKYHSAGGSKVFLAGLSLDSIIETLEESSLGGRLNKEKIKEWFDEVVKPNLALLFADKLGLDTNDLDSNFNQANREKLEKVLELYSIKFQSLAGGKTFIEKADAKSMIDVIKGTEADISLLGKKFIIKLTKMHEKKEVDLLPSLGL